MHIKIKTQIVPELFNSVINNVGIDNIDYFIIECSNDITIYVDNEDVLILENGFMIVEKKRSCISARYMHIISVEAFKFEGDS